MTRAAGNGFTLVELLVALAIFAALGVAGAGLLAAGVDARSQTSARLDDLAAVVRLRALLTADLGQAAPRRWRDADGRRHPAFAADTANSPALLALVRRGWTNDGGAPRASLQRVSYRLDGDRFERIAAPMTDGAAPSPPMLLVGGVTALRLRVFADGQWRAGWAPATEDGLPQAIEITLAARGIPELRQLFLVGAGDAA